MVEFVTQKIHLKFEGEEKKLLELLCFMAKNVHNTALYELKQCYFHTNGKILKLETIIKRLEDKENYIYLGKEWSDYLITNARRSLSKYVKYHNFDRSIKEEYKSSGYAKDFASFPSYLPKNAFHSFRSKGIKRDETKEYVILPIPAKVKDGSIFKDKINDLELKNFIAKLGLNSVPEIKIKLTKNILSYPIPIIDICPEIYGRDFTASLVYPVTIKEPKKELDNKILSIDLGVGNLMSCVTTEPAAFLIKGRYLKSVIRLYNKKISIFKSKLPFVEGSTSMQQRSSKMLRALRKNANNKINDYLDKAVATLYKYIEAHGIRTVVIGWNNSFKESVAKNDGDKDQNAQKIINQIVIQTPISKVRDKIINKCHRNGINVEVVDEYDTSQKSFYDGDTFYNNIKSGNREARGMYVTKDGRKVNADINAALNILVKYANKHKRVIKEIEEMRKLPILIPLGIDVKLD